MSDYWTPPQYGPRGLENQIYNSIFHNHDLACGCKDPQLHILYLFSKDNKQKKLSLKELKEIKCRLTGEEDAEPTGEDEDIGLEELERLFGEEDAQDGDENTG